MVLHFHRYVGLSDRSLGGRSSPLLSFARPQLRMPQQMRGHKADQSTNLCAEPAARLRLRHGDRTRTAPRHCCAWPAFPSSHPLGWNTVTPFPTVWQALLRFHLSIRVEPSPTSMPIQVLLKNSEGDPNSPHTAIVQIWTDCGCCVDTLPDKLRSLEVRLNDTEEELYRLDRIGDAAQKETVRKRLEQTVAAIRSEVDRCSKELNQRRIDRRYTISSRPSEGSNAHRLTKFLRRVSWAHLYTLEHGYTASQVTWSVFSYPQGFTAACADDRVALDAVTAILSNKGWKRLTPAELQEAGGHPQGEVAFRRQRVVDPWPLPRHASNTKIWALTDYRGVELSLLGPDDNRDAFVSLSGLEDWFDDCFTWRRYVAAMLPRKLGRTLTPHLTNR